MKTTSYSNRFKTLSISSCLIKAFLLIVFLINPMHSISSQKKINIEDENTNPSSKNKFETIRERGNSKGQDSIISPFDCSNFIL